MSHLKIPSLFETTTASAFFEDFIEMNRYRRSFSQRSIAAKLKWPVSYIPDLIKGRKALSLQRAIQFGRYFKLDSISLEKLILLAMIDLKILNQKEIATLQTNKSHLPKSPTKDLEILDAKLMLVFEAIRWLNGTATEKNIADLLSAREISRSEIITAIGVLAKKNLIAKTRGGYSAQVDGSYSDDLCGLDDSLLHLQFTELLQAFFRRRIKPAAYSTAFVHIDCNRYRDIVDRIVALRNWIFEISVIDSKKPSSDVRLFQLDFNLTPIFSEAQAARHRNKT